MDPIEKKPLNHFFPGTKILSMGTAGCNMGCFFCQNWDISKAKSDQVNSLEPQPGAGGRSSRCEHHAPHHRLHLQRADHLGRVRHRHRARGARAGLNTVMVSNGYITREAFFDIYRYIDAANIDLKAFTENFYGKITLTHLQPVLDTLKWLRHETGVWFEITNLIIPTLNDGDRNSKNSATGCWRIWATTFRCTSPPSIPTSSCTTSRPLRRRRCIARATSPCRWA